MSDPKAFGIDQYAVWTHDLNGPINPLGSLASSEDESMKIVVTYADHVAAIKAAREEAIAAAVQRVEALANEMRYWSSAETTAATEAVPDLTVDQWLWVQRGVLRSIAAIKGDQP